MKTEPIKGRRIHPVYADSRYTHKNGCLLFTILSPSRKLKTTFTYRPARFIVFGESTRLDNFIQLQDELIAKMAVPSEMMKGSSSQAAARVHQEVMRNRMKKYV